MGEKTNLNATKLPGSQRGNLEIDETGSTPLHSLTWWESAEMWLLLKNDQIDTNCFGTCHGMPMSIATSQIHTDPSRLLLFARKDIISMLEIILYAYYTKI